MNKVERKRVAGLTVKIERGGRNETVGIGDRFSAQIEGKVTALAGAPKTLFVGSSTGVLVRMETETGRRCARATFGAPIAKLTVRGEVVTATVGTTKYPVKAKTLRTAK